MIYSNWEFIDGPDRLSAEPLCGAMEGGSFSVAAKELGLGQPAVSKRIALLEEEFGSQLFMRTTRKLTPTREAHRVYDLARQVLGTFEAARASIKEAPARPSGTLRISVPSSFGRHYLMPIMREYVREFPEVRLDLRFSERTINLVEEGIELALRIGQLESSSLMARRIGTVRRYLVATPAYLRERPLAAHPGRSETASMHRLFAAGAGQPMDVRIRERAPRRHHFRFGHRR